MARPPNRPHILGGEQPVAGVLGVDHLAGTEEGLADNGRAHRVVGRGASGVADDVRVAEAASLGTEKDPNPGPDRDPSGTAHLGLRPSCHRASRLPAGAGRLARVCAALEEAPLNVHQVVSPRVRRVGLVAAILFSLTAVVANQPTTARPASEARSVPDEAFIPVAPGMPSPSAALPSTAAPPPTPSASPSPSPTPSPTAQPTPPAGPVHLVRTGDTLWQISRWHEVELEVVLRWNPASVPSGLVAGQEVIVPGGAPMPARDRLLAPTATAKPRPDPVQVPVAGHRWPLPVPGIITTRFSAAHPGIDIAAPAGTTVRAIAAATVVFAGWKNNGGGYVVVLRHPGGMISSYSHNQVVMVRAGQNVAAGQRIARVGSTGRSTGPHLDLRIEMGGRLVDPLRLF